jgi:hypothetical protein
MIAEKLVYLNEELPTWRIFGESWRVPSLEIRSPDENEDKFEQL